MARRYLVWPLPEPGSAILPTEVGHHLGRVMRARPGDSAVLFDGRGAQAPIRVTRVDGDRVEAEIGAHERSAREPGVRLEVAFALPKGARAEWLFEHGCAVGVRAFHPVVAERSSARGDRTARWRRIVEAACGQCDRAFLPEVHEPVPLADFLARALPAERYAAVPGAAPLGAAAGEHAALIVGPEGGFTPAELAVLDGAGFAPRGLGPLTLRTETAVLVGAAVLLSSA